MQTTWYTTYLIKCAANFQMPKPGMMTLLARKAMDKKMAPRELQKLQSYLQPKMTADPAVLTQPYPKIPFPPGVQPRP